MRFHWMPCTIIIIAPNGANFGTARTCLEVGRGGVGAAVLVPAAAALGWSIGAGAEAVLTRGAIIAFVTCVEPQIAQVTIPAFCSFSNASADWNQLSKLCLLLHFME